MKQRRKDLEDSLERRFMASGGTTLEWRRGKDRVVTDALIRLTLDPEPEVEEVKRDIKLPVSRRKYFDR